MNSYGDLLREDAYGQYIPLTEEETSSVDSTDYAGPFVLRSGRPSLYLFPGGYCTLGEGAGGTSFHYYTRDHLGDVRSVTNEDGTLEQQTHYYPFGTVIYDLSTSPGLQPWKYNGKELVSTHGLHWYDYGARWYDPVLLQFTCPDELGGKTPYASPYIYCEDSPVRFVDPDGKKIVDSNQRVQVYVTNDAIRYTRYIDKGTRAVVEAMLLTKTGRKQLMQMIRSKTNINFLISNEIKGGEGFLLGETKQYKDGEDNGIRRDDRTKKMYTLYASITFYMGSIEKAIREKAPYIGLSIQQALGAVAGHESVHASDADEIDKDLTHQQKYGGGQRKDGEEKPKQIEMQIINEYEK